jgi:hypothetical protein
MAMSLVLEVVAVKDVFSGITGKADHHGCLLRRSQVDGVLPAGVESARPAEERNWPAKIAWSNSIEIRRRPRGVTG